MKSTPLIILLLFLGAGVALCQQVSSFKPLRYDEDYSFLKKKEAAKTTYEKIKYLPIFKNEDVYFSFGGESRFQYFYVKNENWGEEPKNSDGYILNRYLLHSDFRVDERFRAFIQLQSSLAFGKFSTSPIEKNSLELHQAFIDLVPLKSDDLDLTLRIGRQEFSYGSQRLISIRENPNNRQSFDAVKAILQLENSETDFLYGHYVIASRAIFDDRSSKNIRLWGIYHTRKVPVLKNIDFYYLGLEKRNANLSNVLGREIRHSLGTRLWKSKNDWRYDFEALYQFGTIASENISAWTVSMNTTYHSSSIEFNPEIGLKTELISGDLYTNDNRVGTFNPLFPKGAYFGLAALIGPSNLIDIHPSISLKLTNQLDISADYDLFWRLSKNDGIYAVNMTPIYPAEGSKEMHIGNQLTGALLYNPYKQVSLRGEFTWFQTGNYLKDVGPGQDVLLTGVTIQLKF